MSVATLRAEPQLGPYFGAGVERLAAELRSVRIVRPEEPLYSDASSDSPKRGAALRGALLPLFGARHGDGCSGRWFLVGPHAFVCEEGAEPAPDAPLGFERADALSQDGLPYRYYFVSRDGSFGYRHLETAEEGIPHAQLRPGFGIAVERVAEKHSGDPFGLTSRGFWIPMRDLLPARPKPFEGNAFSSDLGWVMRDAVPVFRSPGLREPGKALERLTAVRVLETQQRAGQRYLRVGEQAWLREQDVRQPQLSAPPAELRFGERWIDIDLSRQIAIAHVGETPWFATPISSGRGRPGSESATPPGTYRIWVKLRTTDMDNLENIQLEENYAIEAVPWAMFFHRGYGLHGTFWHRRFGEVRSHGCVNLAPRDAERLFHWTSPRLLPGWSAVFPNAHEPGTLVRVRRN